MDSVKLSPVGNHFREQLYVDPKVSYSRCHDSDVQDGTGDAASRQVSQACGENTTSSPCRHWPAWSEAWSVCIVVVAGGAGAGARRQDAV